MLTLERSQNQSNIRLNWWVYLCCLEEYTAELDGLVNGPLAYNNTPPDLSERDRMFLLSVMENPPTPSPGLIRLFKNS